MNGAVLGETRRMGKKVPRKPEDPEECPEDVMTLGLCMKGYEQKDRKQQEYEEQFKFKNMVRGLDEDETNLMRFLGSKN